MLKARLAEFGILGVNLIVLVLAVALAIEVAIWVGLVFFFILTAVLLSAFYNFDTWLVRRLTTPDEPLSLSLCRTGFIGRTRRLLRWLPRSPRCRFCLVPFGGVGKLLRIRPSVKNPNYCRSCFDGLPTKTHDLEVGVLFADMRGYTSWSESREASEVAAAITRFYAVANQVLTRDDAFVDYIGDQVMALYIAAMPSLGERTAEIMLSGAKRLVATLREQGGALPVGVGLNIGIAQVGTLAMGHSSGFTAIGDVVNTAARLQSSAGAYEIILSESVRAAIPDHVPEARPTALDLKGKAAVQKVFVIPAK